MKKFLLSLALCLLSASPAYADNPITPASPVATGYRAILEHSLGSITSRLELIAGIAAVFAIMWYGTQYIMSAGRPDKAQAARSNLVNVVIGIVVIVIAFTIVTLAGVIAHFLSGLV